MKPFKLITFSNQFKRRFFFSSSILTNNNNNNNNNNLEIVIANKNNKGLEWIFQYAINEGWEPCYSDLNIYSKIDSNGIYIAKINNQIIGSLSGIKFNNNYGYLGYYIMDPAYRGKGYGLQLWKYVINQLDQRQLGLDGVLVQVSNYEKFGFKSTHQNQRFKGFSSNTNLTKTNTNTNTNTTNTSVNILSESDLNDLINFDKEFFPAPRDIWLQSYIQDKTILTAVVRDNNNGQIIGYGIARPSISGYRLGPLYSNDYEVIRKLMNSLLLQMNPNSCFYIDIPKCNQQTEYLIKDFQLEYQWECMRMYTGNPPQINWNGIYAISSLELG